jgi:hypothetical protein
MPATLADKLALKPDDKVFVVNAPKKAPPALPGVAKAIDLADAVLVYAVASNELPLHSATVRSVPPEARLWICYPKPGKLATDLGRDKLWVWMKELGFEGDRLVSVDDTWSAFSFKR